MCLYGEETCLPTKYFTIMQNGGGDVDEGRTSYFEHVASRTSVNKVGRTDRWREGGHIYIVIKGMNYNETSYRRLRDLRAFCISAAVSIRS